MCDNAPIIHATLIPTINIKLLNDLAKVPTRGSEYAAGYDLYAAISSPIEIEPHSTVKIGTGIAIELMQGTFGREVVLLLKKDYGQLTV